MPNPDALRSTAAGRPRASRARRLVAAVLLISPCAGCGLFGSSRPVEVLPPVVEYTPSGVAIEDLRDPGEGAPVLPGARVRVHYVGWTAGGERFDSSYDRGRPIVFTLGAGQVVRGWEDGMLGMRTGGLRRIRIPAELAYGSAGLPGRIPPDTDIVLEVELIAIVAGDDAGEE
jgi:hypothetical protein